MFGDARNWDEEAYRESILKEREIRTRTVFRTVWAPSQNPSPETIVVASSDGSLASYSISSCISKLPLGLSNGKAQNLSVAEPDCFFQGHDGPAYDVKFYGNGEDSLLIRLRRLVQQDKLEKVLNCFKIKSDASSGTKTFTDSQLGKLPNAGYVKSIDPIEEAAVAAAFKVADAENRSFVAAEAIKEAERISKMAEDTDSMLQFAKEIFEKCSQGEVVPIA